MSTTERAKVTLACPAGHVEIEVSGSHASKDSLEHIESEALPDGYDLVRNRECPLCTRAMRLSCERRST